MGNLYMIWAKYRDQDEWGWYYSCRSLQLAKKQLAHLEVAYQEEDAYEGFAIWKLYGVAPSMFLTTAELEAIGERI